jgi:hypothetical protein
MKSSKIYIALLICLMAVNFIYAQDWGLGPFLKTKENPIVSADSSYTFFCPVKKAIVKWQKADVFNPAAIVKDNRYTFLPAAKITPRHIWGEGLHALELA